MASNDELLRIARSIHKLTGSLVRHLEGKESKAQPDSLAEDIEDVWKFYLKRRQMAGMKSSPQPILSSTRRSRIRARLVEVGLETVKKAIDNLFNPNLWWASKVDKDGKPKRQFLDIEYVVRSAEQLEKVLGSSPVTCNQSLLSHDSQGRLMYNGLLVFHAPYNVPPDVEFGDYIIMQPNDSRLKK